MRAAPAVDAALGTGRLERMLMTLLYGAAGAVLASWGAAHADAREGAAGLPQAWLAVLAALAMAALGGRLARRVLPVQASRLVWDGAAWQLGDGGQLVALGRVVVAIDLGTWVLLQLVPADSGARRWRVAGARSAGADWHGLRVALQAHAGAAQPHADGPGAAR